MGSPWEGICGRRGGERAGIYLRAPIAPYVGGNVENKFRQGEKRNEHLVRCAQMMKVKKKKSSERGGK